MEEMAKQAALKQIYLRTFPRVASYLARKGGNLEQAKDIFHEAVLDYYEQVMVKPEANCQNSEAYLMAIVKNKWADNLRLSLKTSVLTSNEEISEADKQEEINNARLLRFLKVSGQRCMALLQSYYYHNDSLQDIADRFGFSGVRSATVQKYKCLEKVRETVKEKSLQYEDFLS